MTETKTMVDNKKGKSTERKKMPAIELAEAVMGTSSTLKRDPKMSFLTLKSYLAVTEDEEVYHKINEECNEPRCFLCHGQFVKGVHNKKNLACAVLLYKFSDGTKQYAIFHDSCIDVFQRIFDALFRDLFLHLFMSRDLKDFIGEKYRSGLSFMDVDDPE